MRVEPGLRETAAEAGVQGFAQKQWQPLGGKRSPGNILDVSTPSKEPLTAERTCDKTLYLALGYRADHMLSVRAQLLQSCLTLCDPVDCILPGSSVCGILQARMLEWTAFSFQGASCHWDRIHTSYVFCIGKRVL